MASGRDADVSDSDPMGMIPAGTLLKTEFSAVVPDASQAEKLQVGKDSNTCMCLIHVHIVFKKLFICVLS